MLRVVRRAKRGMTLLALGLVLAAGPVGAAAPKRKPLPEGAIMPPLPPAVIDDTLAIGGNDIDARKVRTRMTVAVKVNGQGPYRFVVDSGADSSVVGARVARLLQLPLGTPVLLNGMTETTRVDRVHVDTLELGNSTINNLQLPSLQERDLGGDGMIGIDALVEQRLMMDFETRVIKVEDAKLPPPRAMDGEIVVVARRRRGQLILTQVTANRKPIDAVIDTGSEITIGNLALRDQLIRRFPDKFTTIAVTGVTGVTVNLQLARVAELRVGTILLRDVPIAFAEVPPFAVFELSDKPALLLGTDILETFRRVSLDFRARKVRFQLKRCGSTGITLSTTYSASLTRLSSGGNNETCKR
ncbi:aspartyl protease family protein [Sphingomonas tabacisoli]|uniref:Aspartyl protease family protein n=1 Tax=Sphingomonas tabacisoli TaxID=2249466 RepID=A0ABW4I0V8_9SPHN